MNLNPLKKDDNTDALVKALEDANNVGGDVAMTAQTPVVGGDATVVSSQNVTDSAAIAADPQVVSSGTMLTEPDSTLNPVLDAPAPDAETAASTDESKSEDASTTSTDSDASASLTFEGNDLPSGLSSDADAHLEKSATNNTSDGEVEDVKKSALEQLRPLIDKLDLEPADKFDKYLMMLRASDDPTLIKPAFDAAQGITGEKEKAQALLDIINEINYITANQQS